MAITDSARAYYEKMFPGKASPLAQTDPEFAELLCNFACDEVVNQDDLDDRTRLLAILAALLGCQGLDAFRAMVPAALHCGVTPVEIKETVYQATAYLGIGRAYPFLHAVNEVFEAEGIALPLPGQSTTTRETRLEHKQREMITFCLLAGQGGCEPQLTSHAAGNMRIGNDKAFLIKIISQCLPYLGYPRSLNALRCVNEAAK